MMWLAVFVAVMLPVVAMLAGALDRRRDFFALLMYAQACVYLFLAPALASRDLPVGTQGRYTYLMWLGVALFAAPYLLCYRVLIARRARTAPARRAGVPVRSGAAFAFAAGALVLAGGYLRVALLNGLLYRRLGHEGIAKAQLDLSLLEFATYRTFLEAAPFVAILFLVTLKVGRFESAGVRSLWRAAFLAFSGVYGLNVLVNSRLWGVLFLAAVYGLGLLTDDRPRTVRPERAMLAVLALAFGAYGLRVTENVRGSIANGGSAFEVSNLSPAGGPSDGDQGAEWRLNGIDLMAIISDRVEAEGPALGKAWAVPLIVSLDPIVRTAFTEQLKLAALTTSKSYLLLAYAGIALPDYYSCAISDAYGNFGAAGFLLAALTFAGLTAFVTGRLSREASPAAIVLACFVLARLLPFEQEFAALLFGWFKLVPVLLAVLFCNPLARTHRRAGQAAAPLALTPAGAV